jgi:uncharacterized membrane protein YidH (DUF202 family)
MGPDDASRPFDLGLQPERTALAWRRTGLSLAIGALVGSRLLPELLGTWVLIPIGAGLLLSIFIIAASHQRYRQHHKRLTNSSPDRISLPDGVLPVLVASMTVCIGIICLAVLLLPTA